MKLSEAFPSKFLKADDLGEIGDDDTIVTIRDLRCEPVSPTDPAPKLIATVTVDGEKKSWILNKTNAGIIAQLYGDDTDDWEGQRVILYVAQVEYQGKAMPGIRVRLQKPKAKGKPAPKPADDEPPSKFEPVGSTNDPADDEDLPF